MHRSNNNRQLSSSVAILINKKSIKSKTICQGNEKF